MAAFPLLPPRQPQTLRNLISRNNRAMQHLNRCLRTAQVAPPELFDDLSEVRAELIAWNDGPEGRQWQHAVATYNRQVLARRAAIEAARQARRNAAEVAAVRAAACPICFATHPGEC